MSNLFVIGNGFDLAHDIESAYKDFQVYLQKEYKIGDINEYDTDDEYDEDRVVTVIYEIINDIENDTGEWKELENSVGKLNLSRYIPNVDNLDLNEHSDKCNAQNNAQSLANVMSSITKYFSNWISILDISHVVSKQNFSKLIMPEDYFLTFNYTETLEEIYKVNGKEKICHIHGKRGEEILFGHGNGAYSMYDECSEIEYVIEPECIDAHEKLRKDTKSAVENNIDFFNSLKYNIDKIYFYGFSFSEVDQVYLKEICNRVDTSNVECYLNSFHNHNTRNEYAKIFKKCGFLGTFFTF